MQDMTALLQAPHSSEHAVTRTISRNGIRTTETMCVVTLKHNWMPLKRRLRAGSSGTSRQKERMSGTHLSCWITAYFHSH